MEKNQKIRKMGKMQSRRRGIGRDRFKKERRKNAVGKNREEEIEETSFKRSVMRKL